MNTSDATLKKILQRTEDANSLIDLLGVKGYGVYMFLLAKLFKARGRMAFDALDALAYEIHATAQYLRELITSCGLFAYSDTEFWSGGLNLDSGEPPSPMVEDLLQRTDEMFELRAALGIRGYSAFCFVLTRLYERGGRMAFAVLLSSAPKQLCTAKYLHKLVTSCGLFCHNDTELWFPEPEPIELFEA